MAPPHKKQRLTSSSQPASNGSLRRPKSLIRSSPTPLGDEDDASQQDDTRVDESADPPYSVHILPQPSATPSKKRRAPPDDSLRYDSPYEHRLSFDYRILRRKTKAASAAPEWSKCKSYKTVKAGGHRHRVGDVVSVSHAAEQLNDAADWIAQIVDIRGVPATGDAPFVVYALIVWLYRPEHLPSTRMACHYEHEVMPSNYMQIIEGAAIGNHVDLIPASPPSLSADDGARRTCDAVDEDVERVIWRQTLEFQTGRLSRILKPCVCKQAVDFGSGHSIICEEPHCGVAHHEDCVLLDTRRRHFQHEKGRTKGTGNDGKPLEASASKPSTLFGRLASAVTGHAKEETGPVAEPAHSREDDEDKATTADEALAENLYEARLKADCERGKPLVAIVTDRATRAAVEIPIGCPSCGHPMTE